MVQKDSILNAFFVSKTTSFSCCIIMHYCASHLTKLESVPVKNSQLEDKQFIFFQSILLNGTYLISKYVFCICFHLLSPQEAVMYLLKRHFALLFSVIHFFVWKLGLDLCCLSKKYRIWNTLSWSHHFNFRSQEGGGRQASLSNHLHLQGWSHKCLKGC